MTQSIKNISVVGSIAFAALMLLALPTSFVKADGFDEGYSYDYSYADSSYDSGYSYDYSYPDSGYDSGYSYDYSYADSSYGYSTPSYTTGGYSTGGYTMGGYSTGGYSTSGYSTPRYTTPSYTTAGGYSSSYNYSPTTYTDNSYRQTINDNDTTTIVDDHSNSNNQNCVNNSCNTTTTYNTTPVINNNNLIANYTQPTYTPPQQYCPSGYYGTYPNCYIQRYSQPATPVVYTSQTPYVALSALPYTGLELGFWGTIAYWGFMVVFALVAAYLIAVKRVQNVIARKIGNFLFGSTDEETTEVVVLTPAFAHSAPAPKNDAIDDFILTQINRRS